MLALREKYPDNNYYDKLDDDVEDIICYHKNNNNANWKIALPDNMVPEVIQWFHQVLGHPGLTRHKTQRDLTAKILSSPIKTTNRRIPM